MGKERKVDHQELFGKLIHSIICLRRDNKSNTHTTGGTQHSGKGYQFTFVLSIWEELTERCFTDAQLFLPLI